jgi:radical SAM superfamily enzyme YgiQ (UPF0313 family)
MRVAVAIAPFYLADEFERLLPTTAAGCIHADLARHGHDVRIHDLRVLVSTRNRWREYLNASQSWVMEAPQLRTMDLLRHKFSAGASEEALLRIDDDARQAILERAIDQCTSPFDYLETYEKVHAAMGQAVDRFASADAVVLTTAIYTNVYSNLLLALLLKRRRPDLPIILGGPSVYQSPRFAKYLAATGAFDAVAMGDAEGILEPFLDAVRRGRDLALVPGLITASQAGRGYLAPPGVDLSSMPPPDYSGFDLARYLPFTLPVHATRGCPFRCRYCSEHRESFAYMPVDQVVRDLRTLQARHRTRFFFFCDSLLNGNREWFWNLCDALNGQDLRWIAYLRLGGREPLTRQQVDRLARAGAFMVRMGVDSLEPSILRDMARPQNVSGILSEMLMLRDAGIQVDANIITGFPGESRETVLATISQLGVVTADSDQRFADGQRKFFQTLAASDYATMPIEQVASVMVNVYPFQVRPGSRMYDAPEQDGIVYRHFDPDTFGYPVPEPIAALVRSIPDAFEGAVPAHEILQRVRVMYRALRQPCDAMARVRAMAINLWLHARCLEPEDTVGPLRRAAVYTDASGRRFLYIAAVGSHLPLRGALAVVVDHLSEKVEATVGDLLAVGHPVGVRNALALLIGASVLPPPRLGRLGVHRPLHVARGEELDEEPTLTNQGSRECC